MHIPVFPEAHTSHQHWEEEEEEEEERRGIGGSTVLKKLTVSVPLLLLPLATGVLLVEHLENKK